MNEPAFVGVDWGTSRMRLYCIAADGSLSDMRQNDHGMSRLSPTEFPNVLTTALADCAVAPDVPVLICGMAGAKQGWIEAPYLDCPTDLTRLSQHAIRIPAQPRDTRILPGLAQRNLLAPDVMRGEETMLAGLSGTTLVCMPGTHCKWARLKAGSVEGFHTHMTGEIFEQLATRSTLAPFLDVQTPIHDHPDFAAKLLQTYKRPEQAMRTLFQIRSGGLLHGVDSAANTAQLSGLLIGLELAAEAPDQAVTLVADGSLSEIYANALKTAGIAFSIESAELLVRCGLTASAKRIWPERFAA